MMVAGIARAQVTRIHPRPTSCTCLTATVPRVDQASIRASPDGQMQATVIQPQQYVHPLPLATTRPRRTPASGANRPHRGLRCPPGTYFSSRSLRSAPSHLEENAVLVQKVRSRRRGLRFGRPAPEPSGSVLGAAGQLPRRLPDRRPAALRAGGPGPRRR